MARSKLISIPWNPEILVGSEALLIASENAKMIIHYTGLQIMGLYLLLENERSFPG